MNNKTLICRDCGEEFVFSSSEQSFFNKKGYSEPKRCKSCRKKRKLKKEEDRFNSFLTDFAVTDVKDLPKNAEENLFVIGNGFDILHGVPSRYCDFASALGKNSTLRSTLEAYLDFDDIWADFEEALGHLNTDMMLNDYNIDMWLDNFGAYDENSLAADFFATAETVMSPANEIAASLPRRFRKWVDTLTVDTENRPLEGIITNSRVLCFNYTEFIEKLYDVSKNNICYIHGCRTNPKEKLVLGHKPTESFISSRKGKTHFKNSHKRHMAEAVYETGCQYLYWYDEATTKMSGKIIEAHIDFFEDLEKIKNIIIIGHSLSRVDFDYFKKINDTCKNAYWYAGCHDAAALSNLKALSKKLNIPKEKIYVFKT